MHDCFSLASDFRTVSTLFLTSLCTENTYIISCCWPFYYITMSCHAYDSHCGNLTNSQSLKAFVLLTRDDVYEDCVLLHRVLSCCVSVTPTQQLNEVLMQQLIWSDRGPFRGSEAHCGGDVFMFCWVSYVKNFSNSFGIKPHHVERTLLHCEYKELPCCCPCILLLLALNSLPSCGVDGIYMKALW